MLSRAFVTAGAGVCGVVAVVDVFIFAFVIDASVVVFAAAVTVI